MSQTISILPDSAPFNDEQRAWLNGFLAGWIGLESGDGATLAPVTGIGVQPVEQPAVGAITEVVEEDFPWHDPGLPMDDRLKLAEGRPLPRLMMAAMAQLNCGSCGYDCRRYAEAIVSGDEKSLKLCSPGGKETAKKLKELFTLPKAETNGHTNGHTNGSANGSTNGHALVAINGTVVNDVSAASMTWSRTNPLRARVLGIRNLNGHGSAKQTSHVEIDLSEGDMTYEVGDSLGVYPTNCSTLVDDILQVLSVSGDQAVERDGRTMSLRQVLLEECCLTEITDELVEYCQQRCNDPEQKRWLQQIAEDGSLIETWDVYDFLRHTSSVGISGQELVQRLSLLKPRLYSISSSLKACPNQVHLTVGRVVWNFGGRVRKGVASTMFADRLNSGDTVRVFVQKSHGFTVPADLSAPVIMIGPGTGIAPFRAFLQERQATQATGKNWLFFGDQRGETDFLYREEMQALQTSGTLTRLDLAFSRDQEAKIYVQQRMLEQGAEFWNWLEAGAHVYVCGDAKRMAVDVDKALRQIIVQFGKKSPTEADDYVKQLVSSKRYCRDVY